MSTFRVDATLTEDGKITLDDLPFQAGDSVEIIIVPRANQPTEKHPYRSPLEGKVIYYDGPTDPIAQEDWEALQ